jgi:nucleotide-binding universal stress UspA family protein
MKILLAIDDSEFSERAVKTVVEHVRPQGAKVQVLHVVNPILANLVRYSSYRFVVNIKKLEQEMLSHAEEVVKRAAETLRKAKFDVAVRVERGEPKKMILQAAAEWKADLIVVGSHGRSGMDHFLLGSVSEAVARYAPCSVEIVRGSSQ